MFHKSPYHRPEAVGLHPILPLARDFPKLDFSPAGLYLLHHRVIELEICDGSNLSQQGFLGSICAHASLAYGILHLKAIKSLAEAAGRLLIV